MARYEIRFMFRWPGKQVTAEKTILIYAEPGKQLSETQVRTTLEAEYGVGSIPMICSIVELPEHLRRL